MNISSNRITFKKTNPHKPSASNPPLIFPLSQSTPTSSASTSSPPPSNIAMMEDDDDDDDDDEPVDVLPKLREECMSGCKKEIDN